MNKVSNYLVFAVEYYRNKKGLTGREVADLFSEHNIYHMIEEGYDIYHIESPEHMVEEIDEVVRGRNEEERKHDGN